MKHDLKVEPPKTFFGRFIERTALALGAKTSYIYAMGKASAKSTVTVRDAKTGKLITVKGVGSLKGNVLEIKKGVDLTKPIAEQALKGGQRAKG